MSRRDVLLTCMARRSPAIVLALLLALPSDPAGAAFQGVAGEALLVPFALYDSSQGINTTVYITVPDRIGKATVPNQFTAQHTSPADLPVSSEMTLRWAFFNSQGWIRADGQLTALPDGLLTLDWGSLVSQYVPHLSGEPGYLMIQTEDGAKGEEATFNFFGHARMTFAGRDASIPVMALSDGQDSPQTGAPSLGNEAIGIVRHAPLAAGIRTGSVEDPAAATLFDLVVGRRYWKLLSGYFPYWIFVTEPTLLVVWNDNDEVSQTDAYFYGVGANYCSFELPMNKRLNLYWVSPPGVPSFGPSYIDGVTLCSIGGYFSSLPAYISVGLPSLPQDAASVAFSIVFSGNQAETILARERGRFGTP